GSDGRGHARGRDPALEVPGAARRNPACQRRSGSRMNDTPHAGPHRPHAHPGTSQQSAPPRGRGVQWKQRPEGGGWFAIWLIRNIGRYGGRTAARALLYPITLYFLLRRGPERRASRAYLARVLQRPAT